MRSHSDRQTLGSINHINLWTTILQVFTNSITCDILLSNNFSSFYNKSEQMKNEISLAAT